MTLDETIQRENKSAKELRGGEMTGKETNADRIRNMSDEELMNTLFDSCL